jgi:hypothetical protein
MFRCSVGVGVGGTEVLNGWSTGDLMRSGRNEVLPIRCGESFTSS